MRYTINDLKKVKNVGDKNYLIKRWEYYNSVDEAYKDMHRIYELMKYNVNNNEDFLKISFMIELSTHGAGKNNQLVVRDKVFTKGRPTYKVIGEEKKPHLHIACFGKKCPSFVKMITDKLNKKAYKSYEEFKNRGTKSKRLYTYEKLNGENNGMNYIPYMYKQADKIMTYGELEFSKMKDEWFIVDEEENF